MGDMKQHQPPLTIEEQIENLKSIWLVIKDEEYWRRTRRNPGKQRVWSYMSYWLAAGMRSEIAMR